MQSNFRRDHNNRSSNSILNSGRVGRTARYEYTNRGGEPANMSNGKPYSRSRSSSDGKKRKRPLPIKKTGTLFGGLEPIPTDVTKDPPPRACFSCWEMGHWKRNCTRPVVIRMCSNCGRRGEDLHTCPRCSQAHQRYLERQQTKEEIREADYDQRPCSEDEEGNKGADEFLRNLFYQEDMRNLISYQNQMRGEENYEKDLPCQKHDRCPLYQFSMNSSVFHGGDNLQEGEIGSSYQEDNVNFQDREHLQDLPDNYVRAVGLNESRRSPSPNGLFARRSTAIPSPANSNSSDPVHEILLLAKSIAHLSPATQDLIMRQVMAERKEQAYQRTMQGHLEINQWS